MTVGEKAKVAALTVLGFVVLPGAVGVGEAMLDEYLINSDRNGHPVRVMEQDKDLNAVPMPTIDAWNR